MRSNKYTNKQGRKGKSLLGSRWKFLGRLENKGGRNLPQSLVHGTFSHY